MDKQNVILKTHELEVIGQGGMVYEPCQIGEWWVMPAEQYTGTIPEEIMKKWDNFKALNIPVLGYLIADDMREVLLQRAMEAQEALERERKAEQERQAERERQRQEEERRRREEKQRQEEERKMEALRKKELKRQQEEDRKAMRRYRWCWMRCDR